MTRGLRYISALVKEIGGSALLNRQEDFLDHGLELVIFMLLTVDLSLIQFKLDRLLI